MYYPYLRGKQYELILIRENSHRFGRSIVPIIEPVRDNMRSLQRAVDALKENGCRFVIVGNPRHGDFADRPQALRAELATERFSEYNNWSVAYIADDLSSQSELDTVAGLHNDVSVIHNNFHSASALEAMLAGVSGLSAHIFMDSASSKLYRRRFTEGCRVILRDGFISRKNREHPPTEHFSDLHITYTDEDMTAFGDFLMVGDGYSEGGGPAYAVAIHLTYIDPAEDSDMFLKHYVSDRNSSPVDPGGKFLEALEKLDRDLRAGVPIYLSDAVAEYRVLHDEERYPGLGYAKKLSMQHHIELIAHFLSEEE